MMGPVGSAMGRYFVTAVVEIAGAVIVKNR